MFEKRPSLFNFQPHFYLGGPTSFHLPLAYDLIAECRPRTVVTLGFGDGEIYFTFCQAAREQGLTGRLLAARAPSSGEGDVDNAWQAGIRFNEEFYGDLSFFHNDLPETAMASIADGSVDLLFLNDCDSGPALRRQFEAWSPKLSTNSILMVHGIGTKREHSVAEFWRAIRTETSWEFSAGAGLGVTSIKSSPSSDLAGLIGKVEEGSEIEQMYRLAAKRIAAQADAAKIAKENRLLQLRQVWLPTLLDDRVQMQETIDHLNRHIAHITRVHEWEKGQLKQQLNALEAGAVEREAMLKQLVRGRADLEDGRSQSPPIARSRSLPEKIVLEIRRIPRNLRRLLGGDYPKKRNESG